MHELPDDIKIVLESHANVYGTSVGPKRVDDQPTTRESVVVLVDRKRPRERLDSDDVLPESVDIDGETVPTDVQEIGDVHAQAMDQPIAQFDRTARSSRSTRPR